MRVGDVAGVGEALVGGAVLEPGDDQPDVEAEPTVDAAHPLGGELGQVVVDGDEVHALAAEPVQVGGQRADERLALAGLHLGDPAEVERGATHQLHVEVALTGDPDGRLADDREGLDEQVVERLATFDAAAELGGLGDERIVAELMRRRLELVDVRDQALERLELLSLAGAKDLVEEFHADSSLPGGQTGAVAHPDG